MSRTRSAYCCSSPISQGFNCCCRRSRLCEEQAGWTTALVVADLPADLDRTRVTAIDYDAFAARFSRPLELRRIEDPRQPVFAFLFVCVRDDELDQLDDILRADLTKYVHLA